MSEPIAARYGAWRVIGADASGRRVWVTCACGTTRQMGLAVFQAGESTGCGCTKTPPRRELERARRPLDWRLERGR
jgi:hypothetical protein